MQCNGYRSSAPYKSILPQEVLHILVASRAELLLDSTKDHLGYCWQFSSKINRIAISDGGFHIPLAFFTVLK
jgi:hypothetical protein